MEKLIDHTLQLSTLIMMLESSIASIGYRKSLLKIKKKKIAPTIQKFWIHH